MENIHTAFCESKYCPKQNVSDTETPMEGKNLPVFSAKKSLTMCLNSTLTNQISL